MIRTTKHYLKQTVDLAVQRLWRVVRAGLSNEYGANCGICGAEWYLARQSGWGMRSKHKVGNESVQ